jgi:hypothetical protein
MCLGWFDWYRADLALRGRRHHRRGEWARCLPKQVATAVATTSVHPPIVSRLHYELHGWLGDVLLETFPCFIVTDDAKERLLEGCFTGVFFDEVEISTSDEFDELYPAVQLPRFAWLRVVGKAGKHDFGATADGSLVISEQALDTLQRLGVSHALIEPILPSN